MSKINIKAAVAMIVLPSLLAGIALAAQDRYTLQVPGGLAFSEFKGYENWQLIAVATTAISSTRIVGNPTMIEAYKSGIPENGKPFPDGAMMAKIHWMAKKRRTSPANRSWRAPCMTWTSW